MTRLSVLILTISVILFLSTATASAQTSTITYQGKLSDGVGPANGTYDFVFKLCLLADLGPQLGPDVLRGDVPVTNGIFTVNLDFDPFFFTSGQGNYLEIWVRPGASTGSYSVLTPRQPITRSPYSISANSLVPNASINISGNIHTSDLLRTGSETGTSETPIVNTFGPYNGLVVRRISSTNQTAGQSVATNGLVTLQRDGTAGGWRVSWAGPGQSIHCIGHTASDTLISKRLMITTTFGTAAVFSDAQNVESMQCSMSYALDNGPMTQATLQRYAGDFRWVGTVISTYNQ